MISPTLHLLAAGLPSDRLSSRPLIRRMERRIQERLDKRVDQMLREDDAGLCREARFWAAGGNITMAGLDGVEVYGKVAGEGGKPLSSAMPSLPDDCGSVTA